MIPFIIGAAAVAAVGYVAYKMFSTPEVKVVVKKPYYQPPAHETSRSSNTQPSATKQSSTDTYSSKLKEDAEKQMERVTKDCDARMKELKEWMAEQRDKHASDMAVLCEKLEVKQQAGAETANSQCVGDVCSTATPA
jgi:hypothetical protein